MADERLASNIAPGNDLGKDPVFLVMVTGQIESAEVCVMCVFLVWWFILSERSFVSSVF